MRRNGQTPSLKEKPFQAVVPIGRDGQPVPTFEDEGDPVPAEDVAKLMAGARGAVDPPISDVVDPAIAAQRGVERDRQLEELRTRMGEVRP